MAFAALALALTAGEMPVWAQAPGPGSATTAAAPAKAAPPKAPTPAHATALADSGSAAAADSTPATDSNPTPAPHPAGSASDASSTPPSEAPSYLRQPSAPPEPQPIAQKAEPDLLRIVIALALVAGLGGVALVARRRRDGASPLKNQTRLHTLSSLPLGPKAKVALISVGREALLLGVTEQGIRCLRTYPEDELWSLTAPLPGFSEETKAAESEPPLDKSWMERGMESAFSDLLKRAHKSEAVSAKAAAAVEKPAGVPHTGARNEPVDDFTPTALRQRQAGATPLRKVEADAMAELPPHLAALLRENSLDTAAPAPSKPTATKKVVPLRTQSDDVFCDPEGQAAELQRRFSELSS